MSRPQFYANTLEPVDITPEKLQKTLEDLLVAVRRGVDVIQKESPPSEDWGSSGLYTGPAGIALAFLRLDRQRASLGVQDESPTDFCGIAQERIPSQGPKVKLQPGRLSPVGSSSPLTAVVMRILTAGSYGHKVNVDDVELLQDAVNVALQNGPIVPHGGRMMGGDEVLFGRAGLLWAILNIREHDFDGQKTAYLQPVFDAVPSLIDAIVDAGRQGRKEHIEKHGSEGALPLMWTWMEGHYGLGLVHGLTGILAVLLACRASELNDGISRDYLSWLAGTVTGVCELCIANGGHLPTAIPSRHSSSHRPSHFVQICHGAPGVLLLMACARRNTYLVSNFWEPTWDEAIRLASERTWEEGLLSKGGGICHGIAGNAWPWLLLHDSFEYDIDTMHIAKRNYVDRTRMTDNKSTEHELTGDYFLSRALAFLLHSRETPPYDMSSDIYRLPDHPFSLTEGLAGTVCAWADACVAIQARLRKIEMTAQGPCSEVDLKRDSVFQGLESRQLGFPTLAYHRPTGLI
ncbi:lanthionine synthetase C family protein [Aspergillus affinis]|uniref:lanthionine synthetase C family protein n=1 Tax=Aspergillus affinis TaxID=1070780 RepID=UPI0022FEF46C|nr:lanthionine synthetase C family protein [Aspergillus affinis]KAI9036857.1 lanthionine synthetase C family protein [Aspergillus affinis]